MQYTIITIRSQTDNAAACNHVATVWNQVCCSALPRCHRPPPEGRDAVAFQARVGRLYSPPYFSARSVRLTHVRPETPQPQTSMRQVKRIRVDTWTNMQVSVFIYGQGREEWSGEEGSAGWGEGTLFAASLFIQVLGFDMCARCNVPVMFCQ